MNNFTLLLVFLWVFSASLAVAQSDPCTLLANAQLRGGTRVWVGNTSRLASCFNSIPFDNTRASTTITVLRQLVDLYSFTDIVKDSSPPWNMQVDLNADLNAIESTLTNYTGDYRFHEDLIRLFTSLDDAHTLYYAPSI